MLVAAWVLACRWKVEYVEWYTSIQMKGQFGGTATRASIEKGAVILGGVAPLEDAPDGSGRKVRHGDLMLWKTEWRMTREPRGWVVEVARLNISSRTFNGPWSPWRPWEMTIPIWMPLLVLAIPAMILWQRHFRYRRTVRINNCPECHYSLTGLPAGSACPECGKAEA